MVAEEGGFTYHSDSYSDDLPYYEDVGGPGTKPQLVVPYTFDANDQKFVSPNAFSTGEEFRAYLQETFDALYTEGANGAPRMMSIGLHCRLAGSLNRQTDRQTDRQTYRQTGTHTHTHTHTATPRHPAGYAWMVLPLPCLPYIRCVSRSSRALG